MTDYRRSVEEGEALINSLNCQPAPQVKEEVGFVRSWYKRICRVFKPYNVDERNRSEFWDRFGEAFKTLDLIGDSSLKDDLQSRLVAKKDGSAEDAK